MLSQVIPSPLAVKKWKSNSNNYITNIFLYSIHLISKVLVLKSGYSTLEIDWNSKSILLIPISQKNLSLHKPPTLLSLQNSQSVNSFSL